MMKKNKIGYRRGVGMVAALSQGVLHPIAGLAIQMTKFQERRAAE
jgi:hypothetical protein